MVDLHLHSTASDGSLSPQELVQLASKLNFTAIAVTDHDSVEGVTPALRAGRKYAKVEVVPAVELSSDVEGRDIHILGYFIDYKSSWLAEHLEKLRKYRCERAAKMVQKLKEVGLDIPLKDVIEIAKDGSVGRAHVAKALVKQGYIDGIKEAFEKYIGRDSPCYVEKMEYTPKDVIEIIKNVRGIPVLAHPGISQVDEYIPSFIKYGLQGLEAVHSEHSPEQNEKYTKMAKKYGLVATGGSDFHGLDSRRGMIMGAIKIPDSVVDELRKLKQDEDAKQLRRKKEAS